MEKCIAYNTIPFSKSGSVCENTEYFNSKKPSFIVKSEQMMLYGVVNAYPLAGAMVHEPASGVGPNLMRILSFMLLITEKSTET